MSHILIQGRSVVMNIPNNPLPPKLGEEFELPEEYFVAGTIGRIVEILDHTIESTRIRMDIMHGGPLPRKQRKRLNQEQREQLNLMSAGERFASGLREVQMGTDKNLILFSNQDPRPRTGARNQIVNLPNPQQVDPTLRMVVAPPTPQQAGLQQLPDRASGRSRRKSQW